MRVGEDKAAVEGVPEGSLDREKEKRQRGKIKKRPKEREGFKTEPKNNFLKISPLPSQEAAKQLHSMALRPRRPHARLFRKAHRILPEFFCEGGGEKRRGNSDRQGDGGDGSGFDSGGYVCVLYISMLSPIPPGM
eukprot:1388153-Amorphochlora_amoeboformis.AAC.1